MLRLICPKWAEFSSRLRIRSARGERTHDTLRLGPGRHIFLLLLEEEIENTSRSKSVVCSVIGITSCPQRHRFICRQTITVIHCVLELSVQNLVCVDRVDYLIPLRFTSSFQNMIDPMIKAEKKKKKKSRPAAEEAPKLNGNVTEDILALKQEKKKAKNIKEQASQPPEAVAEVLLSSLDKKKKKKKRKAADAEGQAAEAKPAEEAPALDGVPVEKSKKKKIREQQSSEPVLAAVGDRELARTGKPIRKALYTEHAAVAALTPAEVDAWRAERDTVVTGSDLSPVMAFDQAGAPLLLCAS